MLRPGPLIAAGRTSDVFAFGRTEVVKVPRPGVPEHWAEIEAELTSIIHGHGLPAPAVVNVVTIDGRRCVVSERVGGPTMWQLIVEDPLRSTALVDELVIVQKGIHSAGIPEGLPDHTTRAAAKAGACRMITADERDEATDIVASLPSGAAVLHGDLHPGNVIMADRGPTVVDWFDVAIGHPIADVARSSLLMQPCFDIGDLGHLPGVTPPLLDAVHSRYLDGWSDLISRTEGCFSQWQAVLALARISEGTDTDPGQLLSLWHQRRRVGEPASPGGVTGLKG